MKKEIAILCSALILLAGCTSSKTEDAANTEALKEIPAGVVVEDAEPGDIEENITPSTETNGDEMTSTETTENTEATNTVTEGETELSGSNEVITDDTGTPIDENAVPGQKTTETEDATAESESPVQN